jgi:hypothetical protein
VTWTGEEEAYTLPTDRKPDAKPDEVIAAHVEREAWRAGARVENGYAVNYPVVDE